MKNIFVLGVSVFAMTIVGCASSDGSRYPASRSGRGEVKESRPMNHRNLDMDSLYEACLRERPEVSCRDRLGR